MKDRIENLYFAYLFILRAVMKAGPSLESVQSTTGLADQDSRSLALVRQLVLSFSARQPSCATCRALLSLSLSLATTKCRRCQSDHLVPHHLLCKKLRDFGRIYGALSVPDRANLQIFYNSQQPYSQFTSSLGKLLQQEMYSSHHFPAFTNSYYLMQFDMTCEHAVCSETCSRF